jgi:hypothetical protein
MTATEAELAISGTGTPKLNKALSQLQGELPQIKKTKTAEVKDQGGRVLYTYNYADLGDVVADVGPLLAKYGLAFYCAPTINPAERREMILLWSLLHESGEEKTGEWPLGPANQKPQSLGSAITYGRRYCFTAATNIVLEDDDDGQRAQQDHGTRQSAGDAWENATPARPAGPARQPEQPADGKEGSSWYRPALAEADHFATRDAGEKLFVDAARAARDGLCTPRQANHVQNVIRKRLKQFDTATPVDVEDLARQAAAQHGNEPAAGPDEEPGEADYDTPGTATTPQIGAIWTVLSTVFKFSKDEKDQARAVCAHIAKRPLESTKNMSRNEAKAVLDTLASWREVAERHEEQPREFLIELLATAQKAGDGDD